jgi:hypothetical protein
LDNWKEQDLFNYLQNCCYADLVKAKKQLSRWDCYSVEKRHRIELKCRGKHYDTLLIEKKKYDAMINKAKENLDLPMYINSTPRWELQYHNKTTTFSNTNKIEKEVAMLPVIDAEIL